jgi:hypothetical protein
VKIFAEKFKGLWCQNAFLGHTDLENIFCRARNISRQPALNFFESDELFLKTFDPTKCVDRTNVYRIEQMITISFYLFDRFALQTWRIKIRGRNIHTVH